MGQYSAYQDDFVANTDRYPSAGIWSYLDALNEREGRVVGVWDDFDTFPITWGTTAGNWGRYKTFGSAGSACSDGDAVGGVLVLTETGDDEGMALATTGLPFQIINTGGMLGFEARVQISLIANDGLNTCIGLASSVAYSVGEPITTSGELYNTMAFVGWNQLEADGDQYEPVYQESGDTKVTVKADAVTMVASTWVKLGFLFEPERKLLTYFVNGVPLVDTVSISDTAAAEFPNNVRLGMCLGTIADDTSPGTFSIDWWKCYQAI